MPAGEPDGVTIAVAEERDIEAIRRGPFHRDRIAVVHHRQLRILAQLLADLIQRRSLRFHVGGHR